MANVDRVNGLVPIKHLDGSPFNGAVNRYHVAAGDATAIFIGDAVKSTGTADTRGVPTVTQAAAGDAIRGVVVGIESPLTEDTLYRTASTEMYVLVVDAPDVIFAIQEDSDLGALAVTAVGGNADLIVGAGDASLGTSGMELDSSSAVTTTAQLRILRLHDTQDNEVGVNALWEVLINEHELKSTAGV